ncbi:MAG: 50S ribosomal protein L21e [Nanoarchaeota archaeon]|nr:50S ribosomal protein L21e [Nanoarchaeota archaeon]
MGKKKLIRTRGKLKLSRYFQELEKGDKVAVILEPAVQPRIPKRLQGRTGVVEDKKGRVYVVRINDQDQVKKFLIEPIHLKKMKI